MKNNSIYLVIAMLICAHSVKAQLKVTSGGQVCVGTISPTSTYALTVEGYPGAVVKYGNSYIRFTSSYSGGVIGSSTDELDFWYNGSIGHNKIFAEELTETSDSMLKTNINLIENGLGIIEQFKPYSYTFKDDAERGEKGMRYGFMAQQIERVLPAITDTSHGVMGIKYTQIIPFLVKGMQEQQATIEKLQDELEELRGKRGAVQSSDDEDQRDDNIELGQNRPNPFYETTSISYTVPESSSAARIIIYDMQGTEKKSYQLNDRGTSELNIQGKSLAPGMYLYALIVDGKLADTKKMILTGGDR